MRNYRVCLAPLRFGAGVGRVTALVLIRSTGRIMIRITVTVTFMVTIREYSHGYGYGYVKAMVMIRVQVMDKDRKWLGPWPELQL